MGLLQPGSPDILQPGHLQTETLIEFPDIIRRSRNLRERIGRTANGDAELILEYEGVQDRINYLLDIHEMGKIAVILTPDEQPTVEIPVQGYQPESD